MDGSSSTLSWSLPYQNIYLNGFDKTCLDSNSNLRHINSTQSAKRLPPPPPLCFWHTNHQPPKTPTGNLPYPRAMSRHSALTSFIPDVWLEKFKKTLSHWNSNLKRHKTKTQTYLPKPPSPTCPLCLLTDKAVCPVPGLRHSVSYDVSPPQILTATQAWSWAKLVFKQ